MSQYRYLEVELKLREDKNIVLTSNYFQGSIEESLRNFFGEVGGQTDLKLLAFDKLQKRGILRIGEEYLSRTRAAIALIGYYQTIPCSFELKNISKDPITL